MTRAYGLRGGVFRTWLEDENRIIVKCLNERTTVEVCMKRLEDEGYSRTREATLKQARRMRDEGRTTSIFTPAVPHSGRNQHGHWVRRSRNRQPTATDNVQAANERKAKADAQAFLDALQDFERPPVTLSIKSSGGTTASTPAFAFDGSGCSCALGD